MMSLCCVAVCRFILVIEAWFIRLGRVVCRGSWRQRGRTKPSADEGAVSLSLASLWHRAIQPTVYPITQCRGCMAKPFLALISLTILTVMAMAEPTYPS